MDRHGCIARRRLEVWALRLSFQSWPVRPGRYGSPEKETATGNRASWAWDRSEQEQWIIHPGACSGCQGSYDAPAISARASIFGKNFRESISRLCGDSDIPAKNFPETGAGTFPGRSVEI